MPYTQVTLGQFTQEISASLGDTGNVFWKVLEIECAIREGLRLWGALTSYWRARGSFNAVAGEPFYDLSSAASTSAQMAALRPRTYVLNRMVQEIQFMLMEPPGGVAAPGMTGQFPISSILSAISRARSQFVLDARMPYSTSQMGVVSPPAGRFDLSDNVALVERVAWHSTTGAWQPLIRDDGYSAGASNYLWTIDPGDPVAYSLAETQPVQMQLYPIPLASGEVHLVYVASTPVDTTDPNATFNVPDEYVEAIKYYAVYTLLSGDSVGSDMFRAQYALERYRGYIEVAKQMRSVILVQVNGVPVQLDTLAALDRSGQYWQTNRSRPTVAACLFDMVALANVPDAAYGVSCDVVQSAPVPLSFIEYIQMGREELEYLLDYVKHALSFKMGGQELRDSMGMYDNFVRGAAQRAKLLDVKTRYLTPMFGVPKKEEAYVPSA